MCTSLEQEHFDKDKEYYLKSKDKAEKSYNVLRHVQLNMSKYKKNCRFTNHYLEPTAQLLFKSRFPKVDKHTGGKWLIHDTKRRKNNQLQSLKLPCRISHLSS